MKLEVLSIQGQATNWIIAGLKRRNYTYYDDVVDLCEEVAKELKMEFELKQDGTLFFKDKQ